jgi:FkbM family methyltransferase
LKSIKAILLSLLGQRRYLQLTSALFFRAFQFGWLKNDPAYYTHHFVRHFVQPGQVVIDIGANLGYYSRLFSNLVGPAGKVLAVEPIALYRSVLTPNLRQCANVTILPYALGEAEGPIHMGNPSADKHRHGLMRVLRKEDEQKAGEVYEVAMKHPVQLFDGEPVIHYIKCDIEGYEVPVIPAMRPIIDKHRPIVQVETESDNLALLFHLFNNLRYTMFYVQAGQLIPYKDAGQHLPADLIALPAELAYQYQSFVRHEA